MNHYQLSIASSILSTMNLPVSPCSVCPLTCSDFTAKGCFHRITRETSPALVQHFVLYPLSFSGTFLLSELQEDKPLYATINPRLRCRSVYVPTAPAIYASIIRMMLNYPQLSRTSVELRAELSSLIVFNLLGYDLQDLKAFCVDDADWEAEDTDESLEKAARTIKHWGVDCVWREGEEWIGDTLTLFTGGKGKLECLPYSSPLQLLWCVTTSLERGRCATKYILCLVFSMSWTFFFNCTFPHHFWFLCIRYVNYSCCLQVCDEPEIYH